VKHLEALKRVARPLGDAIAFDPSDGLKVTVQRPQELRSRIETVVRSAAFEREPDRGLARWLVRHLALECGAIPASIHDLYLARGQGKVRNDFTVPALNLRALPFHAARAVFRAAAALEAGAFIFEIARSEMGYTDQRPSEYATCILGAAIAQGYVGPVFIQGDHFQVSAKRYAEGPQAELQALRDLIQEAIRAGFFNIDIDTSTLVDLNLPGIPEQQRLNAMLSAELTGYVRRLEPRDVVISVGGEIGEVGGQNSTEPELRAYMDGYTAALNRVAPRAAGLSKISVQTGTTHGGVVLPDGSIAQVKVDFGTLSRLSRLAQEAYGLGGAVQHGASTLPEEAFTRFAEAGACEVHLATNFQNMLYKRIPDSLRQEMYAFLDRDQAKERKSGQSDEQFYYKVRKQALGPFKARLWDLPASVLSGIEQAWEDQFRLLFGRLGVAKTLTDTLTHVRPVGVHAEIAHYAAQAEADQDASDLAD
jgi:fructose/tagatose bisphosphate aldolase